MTKTKKSLKSFRLSARCADLLAKIAEERGISMTAAFEGIVREAAVREGITNAKLISGQKLTTNERCL